MHRATNTTAGTAASHIGPDGCSKAERRPIHVVQTAQLQEWQNLGFYRVKHKNCSKQEAAVGQQETNGKGTSCLGVRGNAGEEDVENAGMEAAMKQHFG